MPSAPPRPVRTWSPWAREYARDPERYVFGTAPSDWAREIARLVRPGDAVLDLGCGEGRDSVFFAELGAVVTGVDLAADGLDKARRLARGRGVRVCWIEGGMAEALPAGRFDLIFSCGSIHYVPRAERRPLFRRLAAMTRPGGHQAHVVFTDQLVHEEKGEIVDYFTAGELGEGIGAEMTRRAPDRYTINPLKAARRGRIFIDYLRNVRGATAVAAYSPRAKRGAPVSTPLAWSELSPKTRPEAFTVETVPKRLATLRKDPWADFFSVDQAITSRMATGLAPPAAPPPAPRRSGRARSRPGRS